jgi:hypothetical protein
MEGPVADNRRYRIEVHPKTGDLAVLDTKTGKLLDIADCAKLLNGEKLDG